MNLLNLVLILGVATQINGQINWQQGDWAMACDFKGNDLTSVRVSGELCSTKCKQTGGCTHFAWTTFEGGSCWMKKGPINKANAVFTGDYNAVCGIVNGGEAPTPNGALSWSDEFNGNGAVNTAEWEYIIGNGNWGWGNGEKQYYTNTNAFVNGGFLTITAKKENKDGFQYTSSRLRSRKEFTYGVFEMRAKLPRGNGLMSAFWLLANDTIYGTWPANGELDIMENPGFEVNKVFGTVHCKAYNHMNHNPKGSTIVPATSLYDDFHTYKLDWNSKRVKWFVDDVLYFTYDNDMRGDSASWPYNRPMKIIINVSIGGQWEISRGLDDSIFPANYVIDYIRRYEPNN